MGADLITYFCYGPRKLKADQVTRQRAKKKALQVIELAKIVEEAHSQNHKGPTIFTLLKKKKLDIRQIEHLLDQPVSKRSITITDNDLWNIEAVSSFSEEGIDRTINDLIKIWNEGSGCRDMTWRDVPGKKNLKGVVCGELTWGDEPEGWGYQTMKKAQQLGILEVFGIQ